MSGLASQYTSAAYTAAGLSRGVGGFGAYGGLGGAYSAAAAAAMSGMPLYGKYLNTNKKLHIKSFLDHRKMSNNLNNKILR